MGWGGGGRRRRCLQSLGDVRPANLLVGFGLEVLLERVEVVYLAHLLLHCLLRHGGAALGHPPLGALLGLAGGGVLVVLILLDETVHLLLLVVLVVVHLLPRLLRRCDGRAVGEVEQLLKLLLVSEDGLGLLPHLLHLVAHPLRTRPRLLAVGVVDEVVHLLLLVVDLALALRRRSLIRRLGLLAFLTEELLPELLLCRLAAPCAHLDPVLLLL